MSSVLSHVSFRVSVVVVFVLEDLVFKSFLCF